MRDIDESQALNPRIDPAEVLALAEAVGIPEVGGLQALRWYLTGARIHRHKRRYRRAHRFDLMAERSAELLAIAFSEGAWADGATPQELRLDT